MCNESEARDRAKRLYQFVRELIGLRHVPVRSFTNYELVVHLGDLPPKPEALFVARGDFDEKDEDTWLEIRCPRVDTYPEPPANLRDWLDPEHLANASLDMPELLTGLPYLDLEEDDADGDFDEEPLDPRDRQLDPPEEVRAAWEKYVDVEWWPWAERTRPKYRANRLYDELFRMYQKQEYLGETYEVLIGVGLLSWRPANAPEVTRHLITLPVALELDSKRQILTLRPPASGSEVRLEDDMIDPALRPPTEIRNHVRASLRDMGATLWEGDAVHDLLKEYCNALAADAIYDASTVGSGSASAVPSVTFAPAVILRRRGTEGLAGFVEKIIDAIDNGAEIPAALRQQVCIDEETVGQIGATGTSRSDEDDEIFFPLPANREQRRIIERLSSANGIVVEGPPGTGKSQTIANLVCHLLATGKRVLVTSHTARALQVLQEKVPDVMRPLCVQALSNDKKGMDALELSVKGITDRHLSWTREDADRSIRDAQTDLATARERLQSALHEQRSLREAEIFQHDNIAGKYSGTLAQIARRIRSDQDRLGLITDSVSDDGVPPCYVESFTMTLAQLAADPDSLHHGDKPEPPRPEEFVSPKEFARLIEASERLSREVESTRADEVSLADRFRNASALARKGLLERMEEIAIPLFALSKRRSEPWLDRAIRDVLSERDRRWREIHEVTEKRIALLKEVPGHAMEARLSGHDGHDAHSLKRCVEVLRQRLAERRGRGYGIALLQPAPVKNALEMLAGVRVNGSPATEGGALEVLAHWAEATIQLASLDDEWSGVADVPRGTLRARINDYEDNCKPLRELLDLSVKAANVRGEFDRAATVAPNWHDERDVARYRSAFALSDLLDQLDAANWEYKECARQAEAAASRTEVESTREALKVAVQSRDASLYHAIYTQIASDHMAWGHAHTAETTLSALRAAAPQLAAAVQEHPRDPRWEQLTDSWDAAWAWAAAKTWLARMADPDAERRASARVADEQKRIDELVAKLAAEKAWTHCFRADRLTEQRRQSLQAWANAVKRVGKGTGKYANQHRRAAREHIGECQPAIPAWIMPLYRVAESVPPATSRFDVAIIDEASQSGPEALALLFIADKIVVVGDSKQISPDPFTRVEDVNRLRRELIADIPASDALDPENSLFDLAVIRYPSRIRLVEHFRCMPEIIQFSNELCYRSEPLLPLRQFGADRLEPVVNAVHVATGYVTGKTKKINRPEAVAVARKVAELARDSRYAGKTFGVISLLGERQARLIESELEGILDAKERNDRKLICGDAYDFQGDERDVMFLSMVAAPSPDQPLRALADPKGRDTRRYNVAMSRAKDQVWLFHSATTNDLSPNDLRYQLLRYCKNPRLSKETMAGIDVEDLRTRARTASRMVDRQPQPFGSWFEVDVFLRIVSAGYTVVPQYDVSGYLIDLAIIGRSGKLAVECDGEYWHGPDQWDADAARQRDLERCGWPFVRVRESTFYLDPDCALEPLWAELRRHGIAESADEPRCESEPESMPDRPEEEFTADKVEDKAAEGTERDAGVGQDSALPPYSAWEPHSVPNPRTAGRDPIVNTLREIVREEGPMTWRRVLDQYRVGLGLGRLKGPTRESLEVAARFCVLTGRILEWTEADEDDWNHKLVRLPETSKVRLRQRGPRLLEDVPPSEIAELMSQRDLLAVDEETAFRQVLAYYGLRRLTEGVTKHLKCARRIAVHSPTYK